MRYQVREKNPQSKDGNRQRTQTNCEARCPLACANSWSVELREKVGARNLSSLLFSLVLRVLSLDRLAFSLVRAEFVIVFPSFNYSKCNKSLRFLNEIPCDPEILRREIFRSVGEA